MTALSFQTTRPGPLLAELLEAQRHEEQAVAYPGLRQFADALIAICQELGNPTVWPVGAAAERLVGAATVLAAGALNAGTWNMSLAGHRVILVAIAGTTPMTLVEAAEHVRRLGAIEVHACGVEVAGAENETRWETFAVLRPPSRELHVVPAAAST
jgi:hypothetical protein